VLPLPPVRVVYQSNVAVEGVGVAESAAAVEPWNNVIVGLVDGAEGAAMTVTDAEAVFMQLFPSVPVTVKVVFPEGKALTAVPDVLLNPAEGVHIYVEAPPAVNVTESPAHKIAEVGETETVGAVFTVTLVVAVLEH
jgi:hypothetical protein